MKKYWFEFDFNNNPEPFGTRLGCGLTAYDYNDAVNLLNEKVFKNEPLPNMTKVIEDVDLSILDPGHVLPNMSPPNRRGVWFPLGYD